MAARAPKVAEPARPPARQPTELEPTLPEPAEPTPPPTSELEAQVAKLLAAADVEPGGDPNKEAWAHYKAKRHARAAALFGAAALVDRTEYKPAFNMACAAALAGDHVSARIALTEALERDRKTVAAKARKDADLALVRGENWFDALLREPASVPVQSHPAAAVDDPPSGDDTSWFYQHCETFDGTTRDTRCWDEFLIGEYEATPLSFDLTLPLPDLPDPGSMPRTRMRRLNTRLNVNGLADAIGGRGVFGLNPDNCEAASYLPPELFDDNCPFYRPFYWWPTDDVVVLVIPHTIRRSMVTPKTVTIAQEIDGVWKAVTIDSILDGRIETHILGGGSPELHSGPILRGDGKELWTFAETIYDGVHLKLPYLCRIRWQDGRLVQGCRKQWEHRWQEAHGGPY